MNVRSLFSWLLPAILLGILIYSNSIYSQNSEWINYTYNDEIQSIVGKNDTLWLATSGGLVKFNIKTEEKVYYNVSNSGLISNHISPIALDSLGNVWMWKRFGRALCFHNKSTDFLVKFDGNDWKYFSPGLNICGQWGLSPGIMEVDNNNSIWIGTYNNGLINFDGENWTVYDTLNSNIPSNYIIDLDIDKENRIWLGSPDVNGLIMYDLFQWNIYDSTNSDYPSKPVINIELDTDGNKWITTEDEVIKYDGSSWIVENPDIPKRIYIGPRSIQIDSNNELWLFHSDLYHLTENGWKKHNQNFGHIFLSVTAFFIDGENNKWINSYRYDDDGNTDFLKGGLTRFSNNNWKVFDISESKFKGSDVGTIFRDSKNNMWLDSDLITKVEDNEWSYYTPKYDWYAIRSITAINEDLDGNIWFGTYWDGLIKFDGSTWEYYNETNSNIPNNTIWDIAIDKEGNPWFTCSHEIGVVKFDGSNFTVYDSTNSGLPDNYVVDIENDSKGDLYFGTGSKGLVKYDLDSWTIYDTQIKWNSIYGLHVDQEDAVWIGGFGITKFKDGVWTYFEHDDSLDYYYNVITKIDKDANNNLWAIARYGLYKFDGKSWQKFDHTNSGLPDEFLNDIEFDQYGNLWIGTSSGVILFNEDGVVTDTKVIRNKVFHSNYKLSQNYPNPFNPLTKIQYSIPVAAPSSVEGHQVILIVYDILGREIATLVNEKQKPGNYEVKFDGSGLTSGIYFYHLKVNSLSGYEKFYQTMKMILLK